MGALMGMMGGGGMSQSSTATSGNGDQKASLEGSFQNNSPFMVGGSGKQSQEADQSGSASDPQSQTLLYLALGVAALAVIGSLAIAARK